MSLVDEKYLHNVRSELLAENEKKQIEAFYDSLEKLSDADRDQQRESLRLIDVRLKETIIEIDAKEWGQSLSYKSSSGVQQVAYGVCRIGGLITFQTTNMGQSGQYLHTFLTYAAHEVDEVTALYIDGVQIPFNMALFDEFGKLRLGPSIGDWANLIWASTYSLGKDTQLVNSDLMGQSVALFPGKWTQLHRQSGHAGIYFWAYYDAVKFLNGPFEIAVEGRWKNDIYDPRTSITGYSNNAALCLANYMMDSRHGPGFTLEDFDVSNLIEAANICDETVEVSIGVTEKRYTINGAFEVSKSNSHRSIREHMKNAMAGDVVRSGGKFFLYPGAWRAPVKVFVEKDLRSPVKIRTKPSSREVFNGVKGRYRGPLTLWELSDYPAYFNTNYETQDGEQLWFELDLPFTTSASMCQRIAKIFLERGRQWQEIEAEFAMSALVARGGENIGLELPRLGIDKNYSIRVMNRITKRDGGGPVYHYKLLLRETAAGIFDWNFGFQTTVDLAPNTELPSPANVRVPTGVDLGGGATGLLLSSGTETLYKRSDGTIFTRLLVQWAPTADPFLMSGGFHEVEFRRSDAAVWQSAGIISGRSNTHWILDIKDGELYDVRVSGFTIAGRSSYLQRTGYLVIGKLEPPSTPTGLVITTDANGIHSSWNNITDIDFLEYEYRLGETWPAGVEIYRGRANRFTTPAKTPGNYRFNLRAIDTTKNYSSNSAIAVLTVNAPNAVQNFEARAIHNMVRLLWTAPVDSTFPVAKYYIYKGLTIAAENLVGESSATFAIVQEQIAGDYLYQIVAVDVAGNMGTPAGRLLHVDAPPLFALLADQILNPVSALQLTNAAIDTGAIVMPVDTAQTFQAHFTANAFTTPQDQITAGYPIYAQPAIAGNGTYEQVVNYGEVIGAAVITLEDFPEWVAGSGTIARTISYGLDGTTWTNTSGQNQVLATNFQYAKVLYVVTGSNNAAILRLPFVRLRLEVRSDEDEGITAAVSSDASGTLVVFNDTFLDVFEDKIVVNYRGSLAYFAGYTIVGNALRLFLWNVSGVRVSGDVKWSVKGIVSN